MKYPQGVSSRKQFGPQQGTLNIWIQCFELIEIKKNNFKITPTVGSIDVLVTKSDIFFEVSLLIWHLELHVNAKKQ